ncbi:MAG: lytic transglycosylase domain-containing protein [Pseudomonadota bacterium]|nr:lytic transglycosylase domain-containing protein [Pseudomonadota bacterium]
MFPAVSIPSSQARHALAALLALLLLGSAPAVRAGQQREEPLSASVRSLLSRSVADSPTDHSGLGDETAERSWLAAMSGRLGTRMPDLRQRVELLRTVHYEATRAGLEPELVLAVIQVESAFHKYAVSNVGARGYMQVMPFWLRDIGSASQDLFHLRTNLRYGCTILRYYVDREHGDLFRALGRYNGSLGQPDYPSLVLQAWKSNWASQGLSSTALAR